MGIIKGLRSNKGLTSDIVCCPTCRSSRIYKRKSMKGKGLLEKGVARPGAYRCESCCWSGDVPMTRPRRVTIKATVQNTGGAANEAC